MTEGIRTAGDGIDSTILKETALIHSGNLLNLNNEIYKSILRSLKPVESKSALIPLIPKYVPTEKKASKYLIKKPKDPKFIPYEPYKAAVKSFKLTQPIEKKVLTKTFKNDVEIQSLVSQVVEMRRTEMSKLTMNEDEVSDTSKLKMQWAKEKQALETDIRNLKETNSHLENQLKFQAQVNSELKTLLVAAVGEDLESRVQHLTEDKLSLARALLKSADHLTSHQEQTEWLSGQCEVWRSKFLASSVMVEELAKWKSALSNRIYEMQEVTKNVLRDLRKLHNLSIKTYKNLKVLSREMVSSERDSKENNIKTGNVVDVAIKNEQLSENLVKHLKIQINELLEAENEVNELTLSEQTAQTLLRNPVCISNKQDILCKAVMGAASSIGGNQFFLQHPELYSCCSHCTGEIQVI